VRGAGSVHERSSGGVGEIGTSVVVGADVETVVLTGGIVVVGGTVVVGEIVVDVEVLGTEPSPGVMNSEYASRLGLLASML